jgi:hypothetical protein
MTEKLIPISQDTLITADELSQSHIAIKLNGFDESIRAELEASLKERLMRFVGESLNGATAAAVEAEIQKWYDDSFSMLITKLIKRKMN